MTVTVTPFIDVVAGTNGAGKSSIQGAALRVRGTPYFNPDEAARVLRENTPGITPVAANALAWEQGRRGLEWAIATRSDFAFETTLGGSTIPALLHQAAEAGMAVRIWYVALESPELHIARVRARVKAGGHDIPEAKIRERYDRSRQNLITLLPELTELRVFDNSAEGDPLRGERPQPRLIVGMRDGKIVEGCELAAVPQWAKPIVMAARKHRAG